MPTDLRDRRNLRRRGTRQSPPRKYWISQSIAIGYWLDDLLGWRLERGCQGVFLRPSARFRSSLPRPQRETERTPMTIRFANFRLDRFANWLHTSAERQGKW